MYLTVGNLKSKTVVWVQAGIHAGEIDGKDAIFWLMREILEKKIADPFQKIQMVFIPIVNLDGHERFGKWNRPNQLGPEEMGWRTTSQNINLNRDFAKVDAPEMEALIRLWRKVDPIVSLDLHVTDGAQFQPEVGVIISPTTHHGDSALHLAGKQLEVALMKKLKDLGSRALPFYPSFEKDDDPSSGFSRHVSLPRFSQSYWANQNRIGILVESHSWKDYATRVKSHHDVVLCILELAALEGASWIKAAQWVEKTSLSDTEVALEFVRTDKHQMIDFPGYKYSIKSSPVSDSSYISYDLNHPENWKVPFYEELIPSLKIKAPHKGYLIPPAHTEWLKEKLDIHGIRYSSYHSSDDEVEVFRSLRNEFSSTSFEGHQTLIVQGNWSKEKRNLPKGTIYVPIHQPRAQLLMHLLEPKARDSFLSWGFFNKSFEQKEYMESYVTEVLALEMLKNPLVEKEFKEKLKSDPEFAKSPDKRLESFYRKHPSWDERFNLYPVFRK
jgi:hypothetical protein